MFLLQCYFSAPTKNNFYIVKTFSDCCVFFCNIKQNLLLIVHSSKRRAFSPSIGVLISIFFFADCKKNHSSAQRTLSILTTTQWLIVAWKDSFQLRVCLHKYAQPGSSLHKGEDTHHIFHMCGWLLCVFAHMWVVCRVNRRLKFLHNVKNFVRLLLPPNNWWVFQHSFSSLNKRLCSPFLTMTNDRRLLVLGLVVESIFYGPPPWPCRLATTTTTVKTTDLPNPPMTSLSSSVNTSAVSYVYADVFTLRALSPSPSPLSSSHPRRRFRSRGGGRRLAAWLSLEACEEAAGRQCNGCREIVVVLLEVGCGCSSFVAVRVAGGDNRRSWRQGSRSLVTWEFVFKILATEDIWHQRWGSFLTMELVFQMPPTKVNKSLGYIKNGPALSNPTICALKKYLQNVKIYIYLCVGDSFFILRSNLYLATWMCFYFKSLCAPRAPAQVNPSNHSILLSETPFHISCTFLFSETIYVAPFYKRVKMLPNHRFN